MAGNRNNSGIKMRLLLPFMTLANSINTAAAQISHQQWQRLTGDEAFNYRTLKEMHSVKQQAVQPNALSRAITGILAFFTTPAGRTITWLSIFLLLAVVLFHTLKGTAIFRREKKKELPKHTDNIPVPPENIMEGDWEHLLEKAQATGDIKLSIRCAYMYLLQLLHQKEFISYRPGKTNNDYYSELKNSELKQTFRLITRQYEYTWFGNYPVSQPAYEKFINTFSKVKDLLYRR